MKKRANSWRRSYKISKILCWINFLSRIWVGRRLHGANWASQEGPQGFNEKLIKNRGQNSPDFCLNWIKGTVLEKLEETKGFKQFFQKFQNLRGPVNCDATIFGTWFYGSKPTPSSWNLDYCPRVWDQVVWPISSNHGPGEALRPIHARCPRHPDLGKLQNSVFILECDFFFYLEIVFKDF